VSDREWSVARLSGFPQRRALFFLLVAISALCAVLACSGDDREPAGDARLDTAAPSELEDVPTQDDESPADIDEVGDDMVDVDASDDPPHPRDIADIDDGSSHEPPPLPAPDDVRMCLRDPGCTQRYVVAHRGMWGPGVPENSLASIRRAAVAGVPMVEFDIRSTRDGVLVLMHDSTVDRTTDGSGLIRELDAVDVASLTLLDSNDADPESLHVPRFDEALALAHELGVTLYLDIKDAPPVQIVEEVRAAGMMDRALFRRGVGDLVAIRKEAPDAWVLAPISTLEEARLARGRLGGLTLVEITSPAPQAALTSALIADGFSVQQDVMFGGDVQYRLGGGGAGWDPFLDAGVRLLQSDVPDALMRHISDRDDLPLPQFEVPCTPECGSRACGNDGCGGSCGPCDDDAMCNNGVCGGLVEIDIYGYGADTTGGWQPAHAVVTVTSLEDDGPGTLRDALRTNDAPTVVRFDVDGRVALSHAISLPSHVTIDGRGRDIGVVGRGFLLHGVENVILTHFAFEDITPDSEDGLQIGIGVPGETGQASRRIVLNHLRFSQREGLGDSNYVDEAISVIYGSTDMTIAWCRFENIEKGILVGNGDAPPEVDANIRLTMHHNLFDGVGRRMPRVRHGRADVVNNVFRDWRMFQPVGHDSNWRRAHGPWCHTACQMILENNIYTRQPHPNDVARYIEWPDNASRCEVGPGMLGETRGAIREQGAYVPTDHATPLQFRVGCVDDDPVFNRPYALPIAYANEALYEHIVEHAGDGFHTR